MHPSQQLHVKQQRVDELESRLKLLMSKESDRLSQPYQQLSQRLMRCNPALKIEEKTKQQKQLKDRLINTISNLLKSKQSSFVHNIEQLHLVSPLATIARGYGVVRDSKNKVVSSINSIEANDTVSIQLVDGEFSAKVLGKSEKDAP